MSQAKVGDQAPAFILSNQAGEEVSLSDFLGQKAIVLYFYPKDETPGCTREACSFRDSYEQFTDLGAEVIGISADSQRSHEAFAGRRKLPFSLLSDPNNIVRRAYGVKSSMLGLLPGRETFVIDKEGMVRHRFSSQFQIDAHITEALQILKELSSEKSS